MGIFTWLIAAHRGYPGWRVVGSLQQPDSPFGACFARPPCAKRRRVADENAVSIDEPPPPPMPQSRHMLEASPLVSPSNSPGSSGELMLDVFPDDPASPTPSWSQRSAVQVILRCKSCESYVRGFGWGIAHGPSRDALRIPSTRWYPVPGATRTTLGFGICPSSKGHSLSRRAKP
jgi:hypothetical protein